ncbi:TadE/TadG family type IV pilus assembly protein [Roseospira goensis]|uniref:Flp pilus assembly pilin Flp n=1 Tax=Roseospira goensis TaxID=391922 RepID=A0A7W6S2P3_9PROT|nr:Flp pilus assembly pilin Flp [Roseospira goensis]
MTTKRRRDHLVSRLWRARRGAVAIEFGLVALPLVLMLAAVLEIGIMLLHSVTLHGALEEGARQLRTGQVFNSGNPRQTFEDAVCGDGLLMFDCADLVFDVRNYGDYGSVNLTPPTLGGDGLPQSPSFAPGDAGDITVARVYARYHFATPLIGAFFNDDGYDSRLIAYAAVVKGEPW